MVTQLHLASNAKKIETSLSHKVALKPLSFITLTISDAQRHGDNELKKMLLDKYIIYMRRQGYFKHYIWKAEKQQNGRIHFHIVTPDFIDKLVISMTWNLIQRQAGYTANFFMKHGHHQPPSTKIEASRDINQTGYYIAKYISKNEDCLPVGGRIWGCSDSCRGIKECTEIADNMTQHVLEARVKKGDLRRFEHDHCVIYRGDMNKVLHKFLPSLKTRYINNILKNWDILEERVDYGCIIPVKGVSLQQSNLNKQTELWALQENLKKPPTKSQMMRERLLSYQQRSRELSKSSEINDLNAITCGLVPLSSQN